MQHTRIIIHYEKMGFIPEMQDWFNIEKINQDNYTRLLF